MSWEFCPVAPVWLNILQYIVYGIWNHYIHYFTIYSTSTWTSNHHSNWVTGSEGELGFSDDELIEFDERLHGWQEGIRDINETKMMGHHNMSMYILYEELSKGSSWN